MLITLIQSRANNEKPMAWVTGEFRELVVLPTPKLHCRLRFLRMSAKSFILNNRDKVIWPEFDLNNCHNWAIQQVLLKPHRDERMTLDVKRLDHTDLYAASRVIGAQVEQKEKDSGGLCGGLYEETQLTPQTKPAAESIPV